jgi:outer membrane receptor for ferrienterochelin and colicins
LQGMRFHFYIISLAILLGSLADLPAQVSGIVLDAQTSEALPSASIFVPKTGKGILSDTEGKFQLEISAEDFPLQLICSSTGYVSDTLLLQQYRPNIRIQLNPPVLEEVVITGNLRPSYQGQSAIKVQVLSREFIRQIPGANNLMDVIDYVTGVRQQINCGVCGTNDIHINGMEGPYTLVLIDGMPIVSALGTVYGLNGIPASMIEQIEVVKGPSSTLYGSDAMAGIINIITRDPSKAPMASVESQINTHGESNTDFSIAPQIGKANTMLAGNFYYMGNRFDHNGDGFTDIPTNQRLSLFNKWAFQRKLDRKATIAAKFYTENRFGGVMDWVKSDRGSSTVYGESIRTRRAELIGTYQLPTSPNVRLDYSLTHHKQESYYGNTAYLATQQTGFANLLHFRNWRSHSLLGGLSARYNYYDDNSPATMLATRKLVPGVFVQDEWQASPRFNFLSGLRMDYDRDHGIILSPRVNLLWKPVAFSTFRLTGGTGFRTVNIFTEEHAALTGSREVVILENLAPERSINANLNYTQAISIGESAGTLDMDFFFTRFSNRILPDYDADPNSIVYRNLNGHAIVRGVSLKYNHNFRFPLRAELGITALQAFSQEANMPREAQEFAPTVEGVYAISYRFKRLSTTLDINGRITGPMALPTYAFPYERPETSPVFGIHNIQITKNLKHGFTLLAGVKNVLDYTQPSPLINPSQPFSPEFDTAYAYGPLQGRRFVFGFRWQATRRTGV